MFRGVEASRLREYYLFRPGVGESQASTPSPGRPWLFSVQSDPEAFAPPLRCWCGDNSPVNFAKRGRQRGVVVGPSLSACLNRVSCHFNTLSTSLPASQGPATPLHLPASREVHQASWPGAS